MALTIVAQLTAKSGMAPELERALRALVPPTVEEPGCDAYELHRSLDDPSLFHFHEVWRTRADWERHMESAHIRAFQDRADALTERFALFQLDPIA